MGAEYFRNVFCFHQVQPEVAYRTYTPIYQLQISNARSSQGTRTVRFSTPYNPPQDYWYAYCTIRTQK